MVSCSDDDDSNAISYQNHQFANAYTKQEAQDYMASINKELFSSSNIDTTDFKPFVAACRYFNDTYLSYKNESGEIPFNNIINNITTMAGGDLSGLSAILDKFETIRGSYKANMTTKTWEKIDNDSDKYYNNIYLYFKDQYGEDIEANLYWTNKDYTYYWFDDDSFYDWEENIIKIRDTNGYIVRDTIPQEIGLYISGGKDKIYFSSNINCNVGSYKNSVQITSSTYFGLGVDNYKDAPYYINTYCTINNNAIERQMNFSKSGQNMISLSTTRNGENIINGIADNTRYSISLNKSIMTMNILDKALFMQTDNSALWQEKLKEIRNAGYKTGSEEFTKAYCNALTECRESTVSNPDNNYFIYKVSSQPYYDTKNGIWTIMPYYTLNDNSTYSALEFNTTGIISSGMGKIQELINRLTGFVDSAK